MTLLHANTYTKLNRDLLCFPENKTVTYINF